MNGRSAVRPARGAGPDTARRAVTKEKLYLYAIVPGTEGRGLGRIGLEGAEVECITSGQVAAVVSHVPGKLRPERRQLAAHQEVLKRLLLETTAVLPVSFGVVADGVPAILEMLSSHRGALLDQIRRVTGRAEMGLRVTWGVPNVFEYFVQTHPELRAVRDHCFGGHRDPTQEEKIEVGRMFDRMLVEDREAHAERVEEILAPSCDEIKRNTPRHEREAVNVACLVPRDGQGRFEAAVFEAAKLFDASFAFDYSGPWAPHNFVELALDL